MQLSKSWLTIQGPQPSTAMEWAWASARIVVVLTAAIGALLFLEGNPARPAIFWAVGFVILYDIAIAVLIKRAYNRAAFRIGFALDHAVLLAVWWVTVQGGNDSAPNDLYLILFPVVIIGVVRVGWALGLAYTLLLIVWMAWADLRYQPANSYPVDQLPIRVAFLVLVAALVGVLVFNLQRARRDAERHGETMAATQRSMAEGLVVIGSDGVVEFYNPAAATIFGIAPHATSDITIHAMSESATRSGQTEGFARSVCALSEQWLDEPTTVYVGNDRPESQHYSLTAFPIVREEARSTGILIRNITEQWELEQRQFGFVSIAAHDLRTPLTAVMGFSELLMTRQTSEEKRTQWLGYINAESHRLTAVLDEILSVSRIQSGDAAMTFATLDVHKLVNDTSIEAAAISLSHQVSVEIADDLPPILADVDKVKQVLLNLVSNAIKYSPAGGEVAVTAKMDLPRTRLVMSVADQGIGIADRDREKLFSSFSRVRNEQTESIRGTGLGLYICKNLVQAMGGDIWVESALGSGSMFSFAVPIEPPTANTQAA
jgi:signal transduction histidine kinase